MSKTKTKPKKKEFSETIDFYQVFGITDKTLSTSEIRKIWQKLAHKYHPDKNNAMDTTELYELIQRAWETLGNEEKRKKYDNLQNNVEKVKKGDHLNLKDNFSKYHDLSSKTEVDETTKHTAKINYEKLFSEMDAKHKIDRTKLSDGKKDASIDIKELKQRQRDLELQREQDEIEFCQPMIFKKGEQVDMGRFNAIFDRYKEKMENEKGSKIIKHSDGPTAFNDSSNTNIFSSFNPNEDKLYDENEYDGGVGDNYGTVDFGSNVDLDLDDIKNIKPVDYVKNYGKLTQDDIKKRMQNRESETNNYKEMRFSDFKTDDKRYNFTHEVGSLELDWEDNNDTEKLADACTILLELEGRNNKKSSPK